MTTSHKFFCPNCQQAYETETKPPVSFMCQECHFSFVPQFDEQPSPEASQRAIDLCGKPAERRLFIITTTSNEVSGQTIEKYIGIARGVVVRSPSATQSLFGGLNQIVGGNIEAYAKVCEEARREAYTRMVDHANALNADAIIAFRYDATEFAPGITEVLAYGTAVKLRQPEP